MQKPPLRSYIAFSLSLITPGLGQFHNGTFARGFLAAGLMASLHWLMYFAARFGILYWYSFAAILAILYVGIASEALWFSWKQGPQASARWWKTLLFAPLALNVLVLSRIYAPTDRSVISSSSMAPSLYPGDAVIWDKWAYRTQSPQRGDIVVFRSKRDPRIKFMSRVVGLPGEQITVTQTHLFINNQSIQRDLLCATDEKKESIFPLFEKPKAINLLKESFAEASYPIFQWSDEEASLAKEERIPAYSGAVPEDTYFVMGDYRNQSYDSRHFGALTRQEIVGKALYIYWSEQPEKDSVQWQRIGSLSRPLPACSN